MTVYACPDCTDNDVEFEDVDPHTAQGTCPDCGDVEIDPLELAESAAAELRGDAIRDGDF